MWPLPRVWVFLGSKLNFVTVISFREKMVQGKEHEATGGGRDQSPPNSLCSLSFPFVKRGACSLRLPQPRVLLGGAQRGSVLSRRAWRAARAEPKLFAWRRLLTEMRFKRPIQLCLFFPKSSLKFNKIIQV